MNIPDELLSNEKAYQNFVAIDLTSYFQKELDEVVHLINSQLDGPFLLGVYENFIKDYWYFKKLT